MRIALLVACLLAVLAGAPGGARADSPAHSPTGAAADPRGPAVWPLQPPPRVMRRFDPPSDPWGAGHRGVDLLGRPGQEVHAALAGTVSFAGTLAGRGVVVVDHGATRTTYEPVDPALAAGQAVRAGAVIGHLQTGMSHCFPLTCLHWGLLRGEVYLDPLSLLGHGPVRLLPLALSPLLMPWGAPAGRPFGVVLP
ncbi:MAG: murein hydrolase activator EnvC family protein [Acidimicrobiales bacterium]